MKKITLMVLAIALIMAAELFPREIETNIVQIKLNRIYFASGNEDGIKTGASFTIECDGREIISGAVEYAGPGISFSRPLSEIDTLDIHPDCVARLTTSAIDSSATIIIGTDMPIEFFDPEHETLFTRLADTLIPNLVDSARTIGNTLALYISHDIRFSNGFLFNGEVLAYCLRDMKSRSRSYLARYFFAKLLPLDSGGIELIDGYNVQLRFYHPFPRAAYFLSYPDFAMYNQMGNGTGPLSVYPDPESSPDKRVFTANRHYRGDPVAFSKIIVQYFEQQYRMKFAYENEQIDGFVGLGFEADLAGLYQAKALYPEVAVLIAGIGGNLFSQTLFPTSLYYCFNPSLSHIYFQFGEVAEINRWLMTSSSDSANQRFYPFDFLRGRELYTSIRPTTDTAWLIYDHTHLYETARYLADIIAREGMTAPVHRLAPNGKYDIRLAFLPASDKIMPFSLFAAVLELNDQNRLLPVNRRLDRPGWHDTDRGSRLFEVRNRNNHFSRAEETVIQDGGFFPLFRPYVFAVCHGDVNGLDFDFYGFPSITKATKSTAAGNNIPGGG